jgi:hypothetical protein
VMQILTALRRTAAAGLVMTAALAMGTTSSYAGNSSQHTTSDPTGAVFSCANGDLTVTGGVVDETSHFAAGGDGILHIIYTITPHEVTAEDARGTSYWITGASHTTALIVGDELRLVTDSSHFVIRGPDGIYGYVSLVDHYNATSRSFTMTLGDCIAPQQ